MSLRIDDPICYSPNNKNEIINLYYSIITIGYLPFIVFYLKLNGKCEYDIFMDDKDFETIYRSPVFNKNDIVKYNDNYYQLVEVSIKERMHNTIGYISCVTPYEILNNKKCGSKNINDEFIKFLNYRPDIYSLYDNNENLILNPWIFYKKIDKKYIDFIEMFGFMREFHDNIPSFKVNYLYQNIKSHQEICIRILVFMEEITLNYDYVSNNDIRDNYVFISSYKKCKYFGY